MAAKIQFFYGMLYGKNLQYSHHYENSYKIDPMFNWTEIIIKPKIVNQMERPSSFYYIIWLSLISCPTSHLTTRFLSV